MLHQELLEEYLGSKLLKSTSESNYRLAMSILQNKVPCPVDQLDRKQLLSWRKAAIEAGLSPNSWNTYLRHLKAIFTYGMDQGFLNYKTNPFAELSVKSPKKKKKTVSVPHVEEIRALFEELEQEEEVQGKHIENLHPVWFWRIVFETFYYSGIRRNQLLHLRLMDIDLHKHILHIRIEGSKTLREYEVPISNELRPWLATLLNRVAPRSKNNQSQAFNVTRVNKRCRLETMNARHIEDCYEELSKRLGFRVSPHRFRHTLCSDLVNRPNANLALIKEIMGHTDIRTTLEYVEPSQSAMRSVLNNR